MSLSRIGVPPGNTCGHSRCSCVSSSSSSSVYRPTIRPPTSLKLGSAIAQAGIAILSTTTSSAKAAAVPRVPTLPNEIVDRKGKGKQRALPRSTESSSTCQDAGSSSHYGKRRARRGASEIDSLEGRDLLDRSPSFPENDQFEKTTRGHQDPGGIPDSSVPDFYDYEDGEWVPSGAWCLMGVEGRDWPNGDDDSETSSRANRGDARVESSSQTRTGATSTPTDTHLSASSSIPNLPKGWGQTSKRTNYYAVHVIIGVSVVLAVMILGFIIVVVGWKRKWNYGINSKPMHMRQLSRQESNVSTGSSARASSRRGGASRGHGHIRRRRWGKRKKIQSSTTPTLDTARNANAQPTRSESDPTSVATPSLDPSPNSSSTPQESQAQTEGADTDADTPQPAVPDNEDRTNLSRGRDEVDAENDDAPPQSIISTNSHHPNSLPPAYASPSFEQSRDRTVTPPRSPPPQLPEKRPASDWTELPPPIVAGDRPSDSFPETSARPSTTDRDNNYQSSAETSEAVANDEALHVSGHVAVDDKAHLRRLWHAASVPSSGGPASGELSQSGTLVASAPAMEVDEEGFEIHRPSDDHQETQQGSSSSMLPPPPPPLPYHSPLPAPPEPPDLSSISSRLLPRYPGPSASTSDGVNSDSPSYFWTMAPSAPPPLPDSLSSPSMHSPSAPIPSAPSMPDNEVDYEEDREGVDQDAELSGHLWDSASAHPFLPQYQSSEGESHSPAHSDIAPG